MNAGVHLVSQLLFIETHVRTHTHTHTHTHTRTHKHTHTHTHICACVCLTIEHRCTSLVNVQLFDILVGFLRVVFRSSRRAQRDVCSGTETVSKNTSISKEEVQSL